MDTVLAVTFVLNAPTLFYPLGGVGLEAIYCIFIDDHNMIILWLIYHIMLLFGVVAKSKTIYLAMVIAAAKDQSNKSHDGHVE